ncbi:MAG: BPSS1780 family membrane protein [Porticoccaceae bacterium]
MATDHPAANRNPPHINLATTDQALEWLRGGWKLFLRAPGIWIAILAIYVVISVVASLIPFVGGIALALFANVFMFGILLGAQALEASHPLAVGHLFAGFSSPRMGSLVLLGVLGLLGTLCLVIPAGLAFGLIAATGAGIDLVVGALPILLLAVLLVAVSAALLFATPLVGFNGLAPVEALKLSFTATMKNWLSLLVWGVLAILLVLAGAIPLGLGLLVVTPMLYASYYLMYRTIFTAPQSEATNPGS